MPQSVRPAVALALLLSSSALSAAIVPAGFLDTPVTASLSAPTAMARADDGRFFIAQQGGELRVVKNGTLLETPFLDLAVDDDGERGLLGVALDPAFATNHNGGALHFGTDGKLYVAAGENANGANSQSLSTVLGKILRLNADGSIPGDNPFASSTTGKNRAIWAYGLRNPFTFTFAASGRMFINDVGQNAWEEIDDGIAGSNYGWPTSEGPTSNPAFRAPLFAYSHGEGCAITGGAFYDPASPSFPAGYQGKYFFSDLCSGWIRRFDPATKAVTGFATGIDAPVDLLVSPQGDLYYLAYGSGVLGRISPTAAPPAAAHGLGLVGSYYDGIALGGTARTRLDREVNFDWASGSPLAGLDGDTFSVRWTGKVLANATGRHTFTVNADDGVRLWVNGKLLIDDWNDHSPVEHSGAITLTKGALYDLRLEYYEDFGTAVVELFWSGPGFSRRIVPQANLYPYALVLTGEPPATAADAAVRDRLQGDGFAPLLARAAAAKASDVSGKALLMLSATLDPATVLQRFRTSAIPIVAWESALFDDLGMTGATAGTSFGTLDAQTRLRVVRPGHPLGGGLSGAVTVARAPSRWSFGEPNAKAIVVAREIAAPQHPVLFAYERGAAMPGLVAPARRVGLFFGETTAATLAEPGWKLFDAAVRWAVGR